MNLINKLSKKIKNLINYFYYYQSALTKNYYPCKLIGEKINANNEDPVVIFSLITIKNIFYQPLSAILSNKNLIAAFSPHDTLKLGKLAFNSIFNGFNLEENKKRFSKIKDVMLSSAHDIYNLSIFQSIIYNDFDIKEISSDYNLNSLISRNRHQLKLVSYKNDSNQKKTTIIYTIFGRKEGYQRSLFTIINNKSILLKFHPTEALKFGFISAGDEFLI